MVEATCPARVAVHMYHVVWIYLLITCGLPVDYLWITSGLPIDMYMLRKKRLYFSFGLILPLEYTAPTQKPEGTAKKSQLSTDILFFCFFLLKFYSVPF